MRELRIRNLQYAQQLPSNEKRWRLILPKSRHRYCNQAMERLSHVLQSPTYNYGRVGQALRVFKSQEPSLANFFISYDLNGPRPTHKQMDDHLRVLGPTFVRGRILETVWFVAGPTTSPALRDYIRRILSPNDLLIVSEMADAAWTKLLVDGNAFKAAFEANERRKAA